jgi:HD-GYP domain-containing protein (c-di-GMP phosphodiesterase class II)
MHYRIRAFVAFIIVLAAVSAAAVYRLEPAVSNTTLVAVATLGALGLVADFLMYRLPHAASGSIAFIPLLALCLVSPHWLTVAVAASVALISHLVRRTAAVKTVFNVGQFTLASALGVLVFRQLGGASIRAIEASASVSDVAAVVLPGMALIVSYLGVNSLVVCAAIAISENGRFLPIWKQNTLVTLTYNVFSSPVVFFLAWLFERIGPWGAVGLALPLLGVRQLYKTTLQLGQVSEELLQLMVKAIEARDPYTSGHSRRVAHYSRIIARAIGLSARQVDRVGTAALLHDVGKIHEIYAPILQKPDKLTQEEWAIMQTHPIKSAELVATVSHLKELVAPVRHHHENWDGSGYPDGLAGETIPLESRIIMFADTIDAMTSDRPYRGALGEDTVRGELIRFKGKQFDPAICDRLLASASFSLLFAPAQRELTPRMNRAVVLRARSRHAAGA